MIKNIKSVLVLVSICAVISVLLALTNSITAPIILQNQNAAANAALLELMPDGKGFELVDLSKYSLPSTVIEVQKETSGQGYVVTLNTTGFKPDMVIMCAVNSEGIIGNAICLSSNETNGVEKTYGTNFAGKDAAGVDAVDTVAASTKTTTAYKNAMKDAINAAIILGGGSVDLRTEEEILMDNLDAALPAGNKAFTKLFIVEVIEGVDTIYVADNGAGYVCVVGEEFIGVDADGNVLNEGTANATQISDAVKKVKATTYEEIDLTNYPDIAKHLISAKKTASGNYVLEAKGAGYGIKGGDEYHPASNEYIIVRVSISADGKIIDTFTVSQAETDGIGSVCADEKFYGQFDGKTEENYTEIDGISGATLTTDGYKQAISRAFNAVKVLNGGAN